MHKIKLKTMKWVRQTATGKSRIGVYLLLIVIIGGLGCWISLFQHKLSPSGERFYAFLGNLGTFSISVAFMSFADSLLLEEKRYSGTRALCLLLLMALSVILGAVSVFVQLPFIHWVAIGAMLLALLEWFFVHQKDPAFISESPELNPLGGRVD